MITKKWDIILEEEYKKEYFKNLVSNIRKEYNTHTCFPKADSVFNAFKYTDFDSIKVVIIGQDPYHGEGEAHGLCFSVQEGVPFPPSLQNIFKELKNDLGYDIPKSGSLEKWAQEGVLLLNSILSVEKDKPLSHKKFNWEEFTNAVIEKINEKNTPIVFILWGNYARSKKKYITNPLHFVIEGVHPSPLSASRGFFGSKPFSKANDFLKSKKISPIDFDLN